MPIANQQCACEPCGCVVSPQKAVEKEGKIYCSQSCAGHLHPMVFRFNHWALNQALTLFLSGRGVSSALRALKIDLFRMSTPKELQRLQLLNYTKANGEELVGLSVELAEDSNGRVQVRVLMDSNVVSGVTVVPLQQGGCCD